MIPSLGLPKEIVIAFNLLIFGNIGTIFYQVLSALFYIENDTEIFPAHYTWNVAEKGFKKAFMMNKLAMINSCNIILEK